MSFTKTLLGLALILPLLLLLSACGGVSTTATVTQPVGGVNLAADTTTGAADGYVYIPVAASRSRLLPGDIVVSTSATPAPGSKAAVGATVEISSSGARSPDSSQTNSQGYYAFLRVTPGNYDLVVTVEGVSTAAAPIVIALDSITHATDAPVTHGPFPGFTIKHIDLSSNSTWQNNHDRIESIEDIQVSFTANNTLPESAILNLFVSQTGALTPVTVVDTGQVPPGYHIYSFTLPSGASDQSSDTSNTIAANQATFRNQVLTGNFFLYLKVDPPEGGSFTISNLQLRFKLKIKVI